MTGCSSSHPWRSRLSRSLFLLRGSMTLAKKEPPACFSQRCLLCTSSSSRCWKVSAAFWSVDASPISSLISPLFSVILFSFLTPSSLLSFLGPSFFFLLQDVRLRVLLRNTDQCKHQSAKFSVQPLFAPGNALVST